MKKLNIGDPEFSWDESDPEGFRAGMARLGKALGAKETGITVYELPPGQAVCPYHYECGEEEWLLVLGGTPTLRSPTGEERLEPWDVACFPRGPEGAHGIRNETDELVRVLMFSSVVLPTATVYPDSDKVGIWTGDPESTVLVRRSANVDYYDGET
ncbi:MAG TPA: cupin domain-containing protein [Solirubrobacterales bacterium]|nr:cupin domain-containing protein [Solirubrobacterales bacterium]